MAGTGFRPLLARRVTSAVRTLPTGGRRRDSQAGLVGTSDSDDVRKLLAFDRCLRSVGAERNRGNPVILFAPCFVLTDGAGTALALFLWSVERLRRVARLPVLFSRLSRIKASRWVTRSLPDARSGCFSRDFAEKAAAGGCAR